MKYILIDADTGIDDSIAILFALKQFTALSGGTAMGIVMMVSNGLTGLFALLVAMPARPDADGLRHQFKGKPAREIAVRVEKRCQYATGRDRYTAHRAVIADAHHFFQQ